MITPAALSVIPKHLINSSRVAVPNINFDSLEFTAQMPLLWGIYTPRTEPGHYKYTGPQLAVKQIAAAVAAQGSILGISPPALNASWTLPFAGPSLQCQESGEASEPRSKRIFIGLALAASKDMRILLGLRLWTTQCHSPPPNRKLFEPPL